MKSHPCAQSIARSASIEVPWFYDQDELWHKFSELVKTEQAQKTVVLQERDSDSDKTTHEDVRDCTTFTSDMRKWLEGQHTDQFKAIFKVMNFLARVSNCTTTQICDSKVTCDLFYQDAYQFMLSWASYLEPWSRHYGATSYFKVAEMVRYCRLSPHYLTGDEPGAWDRAVMWVNGMTNSWW